MFYTMKRSRGAFEGVVRISQTAQSADRGGVGVYPPWFSPILQSIVVLLFILFYRRRKKEK